MNINQYSIHIIIIIITILGIVLRNIQIPQASSRLIIILLLVPLPRRRALSKTNLSPFFLFPLLRMRTARSALPLPRRLERSGLQGAVLLDILAAVQREQDDEVGVLGGAVP